MKQKVTSKSFFSKKTCRFDRDHSNEGIFFSTLIYWPRPVILSEEELSTG